MAEQLEGLTFEKSLVLSTKAAYQRMLKGNAAGKPEAKEASYKVLWTKKNYTAECGNCGWDQIVPDRSTYEKLKAGKKHCKSCGARFTGAVKT